MHTAVAAVLQGGRPVFVGFSGGLDSTVLLHAAATLAPGRVTALHVNHGLHRDAGSWQEHCERTAHAWGAEFLCRGVRPGPGPGLEARARRARYAVFEALLAPAGAVLLLAHHREDQAETVLLRLLRGRGVYGMPAARPLGAGTLQRPLLALPRATLAAYAARYRLEYLQDPGNADLAMDRNYLRHRVLPLLRQRFDGVESALIAAAAGTSAADAARAAELGAALGEDRLPLAQLRGAADATDRLRLWLAARAGRLPSGSALAEFLRQALEAAPDRDPQLPVGALMLRRYRDAVHLTAPPPRLAERYEAPLPGCLTLPHGVLELSRADAGFHPRGTVAVTFRQAGDRLRAGGLDKPLKQWFQEAGVPPWVRPAYPLLRDQAGLLAVPGIATRDRAPPDAAAGAAGPGFEATWRPAPVISL